jgi:small GTP-binding protein
MDDNEYKIQIVSNINEKHDLFAKVQVVGDLGVGKTSIVKRIIKNEFDEEYIPTVGYDFNPYLIKVNNTIIKFQIWDMCGNDNYHSVLLNLYRNAVLGILVYSVCSRQSFNHLDTWIEDLKNNAMSGSKIILIGNKCDDEEKREVSYEEGKKICQKYKLDFFLEISAKKGFSSPNFLEKAAVILYKDYELNKDDTDSTTLKTQNLSIKLKKDFNSHSKKKKRLILL